jgi:hypothetical protein
MWRVRGKVWGMSWIGPCIWYLGGVSRTVFVHGLRGMAFQSFFAILTGMAFRQYRALHGKIAGPISDKFGLTLPMPSDVSFSEMLIFAVWGFVAASLLLTINKIVLQEFRDPRIFFEKSDAPRYYDFMQGAHLKDRVCRISTSVRNKPRSERNGLEFREVFISVEVEEISEGSQKTNHPPIENIYWADSEYPKIKANPGVQWSQSYDQRRLSANGQKRGVDLIYKGQNDENMYVVTGKNMILHDADFRKGIAFGPGKYRVLLVVSGSNGATQSAEFIVTNPSGQAGLSVQPGVAGQWWEE